MYVGQLIFITVQCVVIQIITAQCTREPFATPCILSPADLVASRGPGLVVSSKSFTPADGISIRSDNTIEGLLSVAGMLPFLGTVGLEGVLPTTGAGTVEYRCGDIINILSEELIPVAPPPVITPAVPVVEIARDPAILVASKGPGLVISSGSPAAPAGVVLTSDNTIVGEVLLGGALPFLGTVGLEDILPTSGTGAVNYNCGSGLGVGIIGEDLNGFAGPLGLGLGPYGYGINAPLAYDGLGCLGAGSIY